MKLLPITLTICFMTFTQILAAETNKSWRLMLNDNSLAEWHNPFDWGEASVVDNEIVLTGEKKFFLVSKESYKDFELEVEVFVPEGGNSGIQFRSHYRPNRLWGYQAEVDTSDRQWAGGLYEEGRRGWLVPLKDNAEAQGAFKNGQWNKYFIKALGDQIEIRVNGITTVSTP